MDQNNLTTPQSPSKLEVNDRVLYHLKAMYPWVNFMAIVNFIGIGFMVLAAMVFLFVPLPNSSFGGQAFLKAFYSIFYLIYAAIVFIPIRLLWLFGKFTKKTFYERKQHDYEHSVKSLGSMFRFLGILTIIGMIFAVFVVVFMVVFFGMLIQNGENPFQNEDLFGYVSYASRLLC